MVAWFGRDFLRCGRASEGARASVACAEEYLGVLSMNTSRSVRRRRVSLGLVALAQTQRSRLFAEAGGRRQLTEAFFGPSSFYLATCKHTSKLDRSQLTRFLAQKGPPDVQNGWSPP